MTSELPFDDALEGGPAPSTETFRAVLARHRRRQWRSLALLAVPIVLAGGIAGFAIGDSGGQGGTRLASAGAPTASPVADKAIASVGSAAVVASPGGMPSTQLLLRNASDGTRVRLYQEDFSAKFKCPPPGAPAGTPCPAAPPPSCVPTSGLMAEVSDDQVAGITGSTVWSTTGSFTPLGAQVVGAGQPQPILVVLVQTDKTVSTVTLTTPYGSDQQTPTDAGWSALAVRLPADFKPATPASTDGPFMNLPAGTLSAADASGKNVGSAQVDSITNGPGKQCMPPCVVQSRPPMPPTTPPSSTADGSVPPPAPQVMMMPACCAGGESGGPGGATGGPAGASGGQSGVISSTGGSEGGQGGMTSSSCAFAKLVPGAPASSTNK